MWHIEIGVNYRGKKKPAQSQSSNEEGIPIKPIKHKRGNSDKAKEPASTTSSLEEPKKALEKKSSSNKTKEPASTATAVEEPKKVPEKRKPHTQKAPPPAKNSTEKQTVDLDKGMLLCQLCVFVINSWVLEYL